MATARSRQNTRLPPEVNRALYVRNLPFKITAEELYDIFGKFGAIRQIRLGNAGDTRGTAFVVYEDIYDAKSAVDHLSGFNVCGRCACIAAASHTTCIFLSCAYLAALLPIADECSAYRTLISAILTPAYSSGTCRRPRRPVLSANENAEASGHRAGDEGATGDARTLGHRLGRSRHGLLEEVAERDRHRHDRRSLRVVAIRIPISRVTRRSAACDCRVTHPRRSRALRARARDDRLSCDVFRMHFISSLLGLPMAVWLL